eukprot:SAG11_NODE_2067_length_3865_cov_1.596389_2_plen_105_part_00
MSTIVRMLSKDMGDKLSFAYKSCKLFDMVALICSKKSRQAMMKMPLFDESAIVNNCLTPEELTRYKECYKELHGDDLPEPDEECRELMTCCERIVPTPTSVSTL